MPMVHQGVPDVEDLGDGVADSSTRVLTVLECDASGDRESEAHPVAADAVGVADADDGGPGEGVTVALVAGATDG
jgi:hypothetical protein